MVRKAGVLVAAFLCLSLSAEATPLKVSGRVLRSGSGKPIASAVVMVFTACDDGPQRRQLGDKVITRSDGAFAVDIESSADGVCVFGTDGFTRRSSWQPIAEGKIKDVVLKLAKTSALSSPAAYVEYFRLLSEDKTAQAVALKSLVAEGRDIKAAYVDDNAFRAFLKAQCTGDGCPTNLKGQMKSWELEALQKPPRDGSGTLKFDTFKDTANNQLQRPEGG